MACAVAATIAACLVACTLPAPLPSQEQPTPPTAQPGVAWANFIRADCEWSAPQTPPAVCFGNRGSGFAVRAVRREGARWYVWDPTTDNYAYVDRAALSLPRELTADEAPLTAPPKAAVICIDRSRMYRFTANARSALAEWVIDAAHPGDVFYLRWIEENSYRPEAEAIPAVHVASAPTALPALATPVAPNPFDVVAVAAATATMRAVRDAQISADATRQAATIASSAFITQRMAGFLALAPTPAAASDSAGCVRKGSELLAGFPDDRYLVIATAGEAHTVEGLELDRVQIRLVYLQCDDAMQCDRAKQTWSQLAAATNAANIRFSDPSQGVGHIDDPAP